MIEHLKFAIVTMAAHSICNAAELRPCESYLLSVPKSVEAQVQSNMQTGVCQGIVNTKILSFADERLGGTYVIEPLAGRETQAFELVSTIAKLPGVIVECNGPLKAVK